MEMLWNETPKSRWQSLVNQAGAPFQQSWTYGETARALGANVLRLEIREEGKTLALAQGIERWFLRPITLFTMGPVWIKAQDDDTRTRVLTHLRKALGASLIGTPAELASRPAFRSAGLTDVMTPATLANLSLAPGLRGRMHVKWRNRLTRAEGTGLKVTPTKDRATLEWLLQKDRAQQKSRRYRALPAGFTRAWQTADPKTLSLLTAQNQQEAPLAAMLFLTHGQTATYHIGWTGPEGRAASAHNLILFKACQHLAEKGVQNLNLGLVDTENAPGLARFKLGAGARLHQTGGTWFGL